METRDSGLWSLSRVAKAQDFPGSFATPVIQGGIAPTSPGSGLCLLQRSERPYERLKLRHGLRGVQGCSQSLVMNGLG
ncbi:hypothetical protein GCM10010212_15540 [Paenarthrobacter nicotinovorans]|nr:hypothetical protein GCM10010212_15540 [Paenarthrobacter nicotinovorans]